jgi:NAD(P)H-quinone oxidoreductase subunit 5
MVLLVLSLFFLVIKFSKNYLKGDKNYQKFFIYSALLFTSLIITICSNNLILFFISWTANNYLLTKLMAFKNDWLAARNSAKLAAKNFSVGSLSLAAAFILIFLDSGYLEISKSMQYLNYQSWVAGLIAILLIIAAISQSAILPFHSWLKNSLNSITPVSALMHAGLVNGGGFLLIRFHEIFLHLTWSLNILLIIGFISLAISSLAKLIQANYKRMLAFSTIAQMSFMIIQCGLGLFSSALVHIIWHGFFKAYLFLSSPEGAKINKEKNILMLSKQQILICLISSMIGIAVFSLISNHNIFDLNSRLVILVIVFVSSFQLAATFLDKGTVANQPFRRTFRNSKFFETHVYLDTLTFQKIYNHKNFLKKPDLRKCHKINKQNTFSSFLNLASICAIFSALYALSITIIEDFFILREISVAQAFNFLHLFLIFGILTLWLMVIFWRKIEQKNNKIFSKIYLKLVNFSAPDKDCSTLHRKFYKI